MAMKYFVTKNLNNSDENYFSMLNVVIFFIISDEINFVTKEHSLNGLNFSKKNFISPTHSLKNFSALPLSVSLTP